MAERPNHLSRFAGLDTFEMRHPLPGAGLPSADMPPEYAQDALMPQSPEEQEWRHWRNSLLPWMAWSLPPVNAFLGGQRLAEGVAEGRPLTALLGAGQIGGSVLWPAPGVSTIPASAANRALERVAPATAGPRPAPVSVAPPARPPSGSEPPPGFDAERVWYHGTVSPPFDRFDLSRSGFNFGGSHAGGPAHFAPTRSRAQMFADLVARERGGDPRVVEAYLRNPRSGPSGDALAWNADDIWILPPPRPAGPSAPPIARTPPPQRALDDFAALQPNAAFPRTGGTSTVDARNAYLALRQSGNYDDAIAFLGGNQPAAESLLRAWQARGVDAGQALRYWQGIAGLRDLERPTRLNALAPFAVGSGMAPTLLGPAPEAD